jgi:hypothetical protein
VKHGLCGVKAVRRIGSRKGMVQNSCSVAEKHGLNAPSQATLSAAL